MRGRTSHVVALIVFAEALGGLVILYGFPFPGNDQSLRFTQEPAFLPWSDVKSSRPSAPPCGV
jgi:hypothetical protein